MFNHTKDAVFLLTKIYLINPVILLFYPRPFYFIYKKKKCMFRPTNGITPLGGSGSAA